MKKYDLIIIGAGPAGLSAAIYAGRDNIKTALISADLGGQIVKTTKIENYPALPKVSGQELVSQMKKQVDRHDVEFIWRMVEKIEKDDNIFKVISSNGDHHQAKTVIVAFGKTPRKLNVPGEDELIGKGVSYCAICDMAFFKDKTIAIVGGGNSALHAVASAQKTAKKIYLIHRREKFTAQKELIKNIKKIKDKGKLKVFAPAQIEKIIGDKFVKAIQVKHSNKGKTEKIKIDGIFVEIGSIANTKLIDKFVDTDEKGEIITNLKSETKAPGLFVAGDISAQAHDQAVIAAGQGATAAISASQYLKGGEKEGIKI